MAFFDSTTQKSALSYDKGAFCYYIWYKNRSKHYIYVFAPVLLFLINFKKFLIIFHLRLLFQADAYHNVRHYREDHHTQG